MSARAERVIQGLGGPDNIVEIEAFDSSLQVEVDRVATVDEATLRAAGVEDVVVAGRAVQLSVGPDPDGLLADIEEQLR